MRFLVTGAAGFIGSRTCQALLDRGDSVLGIDDLNPYYDVRLKEARLEKLRPSGSFDFLKIDIVDKVAMTDAFCRGPFDRVVHLAAQAGVRHSINDPGAYIHSNLAGFLQVLEQCRHTGVPHLLYASSSSVYGNATRMPFSERDRVDHPASLYAATKKSNELMAHSYSHLFDLPTTGLRLFTVYGPWGRPDMAMFRFAKAILEGAPIDVYNHGDMSRDFTYIDDVVEGILLAADRIPEADSTWSGAFPNPATSSAPYRIYNLGHNNPVKITHVITLLEAALGKSTTRNLLPMQPGDVPATFADTEAFASDFSYQPRTSIEEGVAKFAEWYRTYHERL